MKNKVSDEDEVDFIAENFSPVENNRSSSEELKRIKNIQMLILI